MPVDISIVIPTFNRRQTLEVVLPSLLQQSFEPDRYEILISDSGSEDGTRELVEARSRETSERGPVVRYLCGENRGRSGARNRGIREARGRIVLFTDADIIADPDLVRLHAVTHETHTRLHARVGRCAVVGQEIQVDTLEEYEAVRHRRQAARTLHPDRRKRLSWLYFLTGNASVPRSDLLDLGGFDEDFTGYGHEDLELGYRLERLGLPICYNPQAVNYHWHPVGFEEKCDKMKLAGVSTVRFYNKHRDPRIKLLLGMNPLSMSLHTLFSRTRWFVPMCQDRRSRSRLFSEMLLQYHYLCGVKEGLHQMGTSTQPAPGGAAGGEA